MRFKYLMKLPFLCSYDIVNLNIFDEYLAIHVKQFMQLPASTTYAKISLNLLLRT